ncbi:hypothetical protein J4E80_007633 [Alternaria sp. BMP 0032]|nr:hypothetical protein J4E80_007633 [Alternaria sp. BMP 0032]
MVSKVHKLVSLYAAQPKLAQLVRSIDLFRDADTHDERASERKARGKERGIYKPIMRSSGITRRLQRMLKYDLRRKNVQADMALLLLQIPNIQRLLLGGLSHGDIRFLDPVFFKTSASTADLASSDAHRCRPYLKEVIRKRLKTRLNKLEIPFGGLWDSVNRHRTFDLSEYAHLTHVTTCVDELMTPRWKAWGSEPDHELGVLPKTLTHLTLGGTCWDFDRLLTHLVAQKATGVLPRLRSLIVYTHHVGQEGMGADHAKSPHRARLDHAATHVQALQDFRITATLRHTGLDHMRYFCRLNMIDTGYRSRHVLRQLEPLEMRGYFEHWRHRATDMEVRRLAHERMLEQEEQPEAYEPSTHGDKNSYTDVGGSSEAEWDRLANLALND